METYELLFQLMVSYVLPHTTLAKNQIPVIKELIKIKSPTKNWDQPIREKEPLKVEMPSVIARALLIFEAPIEDISNIKFSDDKIVLNVRGVMGLSLLQYKISSFLREKFPEFSIPFGGDTEVFVRPEKFGFNKNK